MRVHFEGMVNEHLNVEGRVNGYLQGISGQLNNIILRREEPYLNNAEIHYLLSKLPPVSSLKPLRALLYFQQTPSNYKEAIAICNSFNALEQQVEVDPNIKEVLNLLSSMMLMAAQEHFESEDTPQQTLAADLCKVIITSGLISFMSQAEQARTASLLNNYASIYADGFIIGKKSKPEDVIALYEIARPYLPVTTGLNIAKVYMGMKKFAAAEAVLLPLIDNHSEAIFLLAGTKLHTKKFKEAAALYQQAMDANHPAAAAQLAHMHGLGQINGKPDYEAEKALLEEAIALGSVSAHYWLGERYRQKKEFALAIPCFRRVIDEKHALAPEAQQALKAIQSAMKPSFFKSLKSSLFGGTAAAQSEEMHSLLSNSESYGANESADQKTKRGFQ